MVWCFASTFLYGIYSHPRPHLPIGRSIVNYKIPNHYFGELRDRTHASNRKHRLVLLTLQICVYIFSYLLQIQQQWPQQEQRHKCLNDDFCVKWWKQYNMYSNGVKEATKQKERERYFSNTNIGRRTYFYLYTWIFIFVTMHIHTQPATHIRTHAKQLGQLDALLFHPPSYFSLYFIRHLFFTTFCLIRMAKNHFTSSGNSAIRIQQSQSTHKYINVYDSFYLGTSIKMKVKRKFSMNLMVCPTTYTNSNKRMRLYILIDVYLFWFFYTIDVNRNCSVLLFFFVL